MKRIIFSILLAIVATMPTMAQKALFGKYADTKGVSTAYVSKTMFAMMPTIKACNKDISAIAKKLECLYVLNCERPSLMGKIGKDAKAFYHKGGYELAMQTHNGGETTEIWSKPHGGGINEFALFTKEKNELTIICVIGRITLNEIKNLND